VKKNKTVKPINQKPIKQKLKPNPNAYKINSIKTKIEQIENINDVKDVLRDML
jgi:hypothetical protein